MQSLSEFIPCVVKRGGTDFSWRASRHTYRDGCGEKKEKSEIQSLASLCCCDGGCVGPVHREHLENYLTQLEAHAYGLSAVPVNRSKTGDLRGLSRATR